jgi:hypothetical protein
MSLSEEKQILLSQLVDGELPAEQANQVLADVLNELAHVLSGSESAWQLHQMLASRQVFAPWRRQELPKTIVALPSPRLADRASPFGWRLIGLASAAVLGGVLVAAGFFLRGQLGIERAPVAVAQQPAVIVTPQQRREIARVFALHESVAGPLSWYAADETTIQVAPAQKGETMLPPIAVVLRLTRDASSPDPRNGGPKTYVIVCRNGDAAIRLPPSAMAKAMRLRLLPVATRGKIDLQYAIAADGSNHGPDEAALAGCRHLDDGQTPLGQLALNDGLVNIDASAWVIQNHAR